MNNSKVKVTGMENRRLQFVNGKNMCDNIHVKQNIVCSCTSAPKRSGHQTNGHILHMVWFWNATIHNILMS